MKPLFLLLLVLPLTALAQFGPKPKHPDAQWTSRLDVPTHLTVGGSVTLEFEVRIPEHYHIYSSVPSPKPAGLPTALVLDDGTTGLVAEGALEEIGQRQTKYDDVFETDVYYFEGSARFRQRFRVTAPQARLVGALRYQICDTTSCRSLGVEFDHRIAAQAASVSAARSAAAPAAPGDAGPARRAAAPLESPASGDSNGLRPTAEAAGPEPPSADGAAASPSAPAPEQGLLQLFLLAFGAGLIGLLTPCVFPMIPLTVSYFTKQSTSRAQGIRNALIYSGSIVFMFVVLGFTLSYIFGSATLYRMASNPFLNLAFFVILFVFGLSFLGWFEISLPASWANAADRQSEKGGVLGIFFMALTLVLVSFSCTGPLVGTLLVQAAAGSFLAPAVGMLGFSLAFALPFGGFALFPNAVNALPKSGNWLNSVKVVLGFLELALALKFLSNADLVWHWGLLDREIYLAAWIVLFTLLGFYLLGKLRLPHDTVAPSHVSIPRLLLAVLTFTFVLYLFPGLWGAPLKAISNFLPPVNDDIGVKPAGYVSGFSSGGTTAVPTAVCNVTDRKYAQALAKSTPPGFCTFYDLEQARAYARLVNKPLFIDFTGHTCVNCRDMEAKVWPDPRVKKLLNEDYVMVQLFVDDESRLDKIRELPNGGKLRTIGDLWLNLQESKYQTNAQPYYVLADAEMNSLVAPRAYDTDVSAYVEFLNAGLEAYLKR